MATALRMEVTSATIINAVKKMKKKERLIFLEDLMAATSPEYLLSTREARRDYKAGKVKSHEDVFGRRSIGSPIPARPSETSPHSNTP